MMRNQMVVRLAGGEILKGFSHDFAPNKPVFHLQTVDSSGEVGDAQAIKIEDIGAIFFVRDFAFDRTDRLTSPPGEEEPLPPPAGARPVHVKFQWGEEVEGLTYGYDPKRPGFFLYLTAPLDRVHNLERMFIGRGAVEEVKLL
jgi:hypothetical protein